MFSVSHISAIIVWKSPSPTYPYLNSFAKSNYRLLSRIKQQAGYSLACCLSLYTPP